jgi:REP element-mobilizing transposase RayT
MDGIASVMRAIEERRNGHRIGICVPVLGELWSGVEWWLRMPAALPTKMNEAQMPQSLADVVIHIVFSTKTRVPFLKLTVLRERLDAYIVGTLMNLDCPSIITRSVEDHIHILCHLSRTISIGQLIKEIKTSSSAWVKQQDPHLDDFYWQAGYGAFSVSRSNVEQVKQYIANQEEHHRTRTFQEEFRLLLQRHGIEYDERYVWD